MISRLGLELATTEGDDGPEKPLAAVGHGGLMSREYITPREAAEYLRCNVKVIYNACNEGQSPRLRHVRRGRQILTTREWCDAWVEAGGRKH
jgi:excisionase family DNA binding protein